MTAKLKRPHKKRGGLNTLDNAVSAVVPHGQMSEETRRGATAVALEAQRNSKIAASTKEEQVARIRQIETELLEEARLVTSDAMKFYELPFDATEAPHAWVVELGSQQAADERFRRVKAGQLASAEAPTGLKVAGNIVGSVLRGKREEAPAPELNIRVAVLTQGEGPVYDRLPVEK